MKTKIIFLFSLFLFSVVFTGCSNKIEDEQAFPHTITSIPVGQGNLYGGGNEGISKQAIVITANAEWESLINKMNSVNQVTGDFSETAIDFSKYTVIAVFDGVKSSGGWSIDITDITEYFDSIAVSVKNLHIGGNTSVMTQPFHIVKIPVLDKKVVFDWEESYPQNMEVSDYSLPEGCSWTTISTRLDTVYAIRSIEELGNCISCSEGNYPEVDFSKYSLIYACGYATSSPAEVMKKQLHLISNNEYSLYLEIRPGPALTPGHWVISIIAPKLDQNAIVSLDVNNYKPF